MPHLRIQERTQKLLKKGMKYERQGQSALAEKCYRNALEVDPLCREARQRLDSLVNGAPSRPLARLPGATPGKDAEEANRRGQSHLAAGNCQAAIDCFRQVTALLPKSAQAHAQLGAAEEGAGDLQAAVKSYGRALEIEPDSVDFHSLIGRVLYRSGALESAAEFYKRAVTIDPKRADICNDLGLVFTGLNNFAAATEAFTRSLRLNPRSAKTIAALGSMFERKGDLESAADAYRDAIKLDPKLHAAYGDLAFVLYGLGELVEAEDCYRRLGASEPDNAEPIANLGLIHLLQGDFEAGWAEYEARWRVGVGDERAFSEKRWKGEPLDGARILIFAEQGLGDTIQFARYAPMIRACGGDVVLEVQPPLKKLLSQTDGTSCVMSRGEALPEFTWQCPLMSVPLALGTRLDTIPAATPYIRVDAGRAEAWRSRLTGNAKRIGLAWAGSPAHPRNRLRSIPLELMIPLLRVKQACFYSLQFGEGVEQIKQLPRDVPLFDFGEELKELTELAALVANLDLVITVDTAVAHLAGGIGKPVWILLGKGCDWRWLLEREDSPWYPSARLFRQAKVGDWTEMLSRVEKELKAGVD